MIVLHYTGMESGKAALDWLVCEESQVSCHYLVEEDGSIIQMVPEAKRAWHAGKSCWKGCHDINSKSIGIEIVNLGHELGYQEFPDIQVSSVIALCQDIVERNCMDSRQIVGHSDIAPGRKVDPGELFPWRRLYESGLGIWVPPFPLEEVPGKKTILSAVSKAEFIEKLGALGYCTELAEECDQKLKALTHAFQSHFRPEKVDGKIDRSTLRTLESLVSC